MNLTDGATFLMALIKRAKSRFNQKIKFPRNTKQRICETEIKNGWNPQVVNTLREESDGKFIFKGNMISRVPKNVELSHKWILKNTKFQEQVFYAGLVDESEKRPFKFPPGRIKKDKIRKSVPGVNLTLPANYPVHPRAPTKSSAHAYTQNCPRIRAQQRTTTF